MVDFLRRHFSMGNTAEVQAKFDELKGVIYEMKQKPGPLMPVMQKAQEIFGSLPFEVQKFIAEEMNIPMTDVYGVATFYSQFALEPKGKHVIGVCMGTVSYTHLTGIGVGGTSILAIFVVLCLVTLASLSLVSAQADYGLAKKTAEAAQEYYACLLYTSSNNAGMEEAVEKIIRALETI